MQIDIQDAANIGYAIASTHAVLDVTKTLDPRNGIDGIDGLTSTNIAVLRVALRRLENDLFDGKVPLAEVEEIALGDYAYDDVDISETIVG